MPIQKVPVGGTKTKEDHPGGNGLRPAQARRGEEGKRRYNPKTKAK